MNKPDRDNWQSELLDEIFIALASDADIRENLVFKGARVLNMLLKTQRQSLDIDSNFTQAFYQNMTEVHQQEKFLQEHLPKAIKSHFNNSEYIRYKLQDIEIKSSPPKPHPHNWDGFKISLHVTDHLKGNTRGLPPLELDVSSPEKWSDASIKELKKDGYIIKAYSLERIAGEKLRAFLSSLPAYRRKLSKTEYTIRVKDLYDEVQIEREKPISDITFWMVAASEFKLACESRYIDCAGIETFKENWDITRQTFQKDNTLPKDVTFDLVNQCLSNIVGFFEQIKTFPLEFPLPPAH